MKYNALFSLISAAVLFSGCAKVPQKSEEKIPEKPSPVQEIASDTVAFVRMHPGAAQKNSYATWKHYENHDDGSKFWRIQQKDISEQAVTYLNELLESAQKDLIPSDKLYACRYRENMPQYRLNFQHDNKTFAIVSSSGCLHGAPWNVIIDGKSYIQLSGAIGTALEKLLATTENPINIGDAAGMIMFNEPIEIDGFTPSGESSPAAWYHAEFLKDASFGGAIQYIENLFGPLQMPEIACNQSKSDNCSDVSARYTLKINADFEYPMPIKYIAGKVSSSIPPQTAFEQLATATKSSIFKMWPQAAARPDPIRLKWENPDDCPMVRGLAKHFELPDNVACGMWNMTSKDFPSAIYYTGLQSIWLEPAHNYKTYFDAVRQLQSQNREKKITYSKFQNPDKSTNLFVRLDGRPIAFVTKDGKTSIVSD